MIFDNVALQLRHVTSLYLGLMTELSGCVDPVPKLSLLFLLIYRPLLNHIIKVHCKSANMSMTLEDAAGTRQPRPVPDTPESVFAQLSMKGKTVAITGAADGIGLAAAEAVAEAGANVALWYNSNPAAVERAQQLEQTFKITAKAYQVDVSDYSAVEKTLDSVVQDFGKVDVFVANAGMAISKAITEQTIDEYKKQMSVNRKLEVNGVARRVKSC